MLGIFQAGQKFEKDTGNGLQVVPTVICSRDKDLRMINGWHYGWECGKQPEFQLYFVNGFGELRLTDKKPRECKGHGLKFFYAQMIMGDPTDNIVGIPRKGAVAAFNALDKCVSEDEAFEVVRELYREHHGDDYRTHLYEMAHLLWMVIQVDGKGQPLMWIAPDERK